MLKNGQIFEKLLSILCLLALFSTLSLPTFCTPVYALISFGDDCLQCHQSGITVATNSTETVQIEPNASFTLEVTATGGTSRDMVIVWSDVSHNKYFTFTPSLIEDNDRNDDEPAGGQITGLFTVSTPDVSGNYIIKTFVASSQGRGGAAEVKVTVGSGGEIPLTPFEVIMELLTSVAPMALVGIAIVGITLYIVSWRRIPQE